MGSVLQPISPPRAVALAAGPVLLALAAFAYGMLEVHMSTDTWIGLAAGRQILELGRVPTTDTFSFTFPGQPWYNQNWGTHAIQYWLYSRFGPNSVIFADWSLIFATYVLIALAAYGRTHTWIGALQAGAVAAWACRDYMSPRPATTGFFCMAALWALLCALEGQDERKRLWPIGVLLPLLLFWGCVHGSFTFGYGILGLYVVVWAAVQLFRPRWNAVDRRQILTLITVVAIALGLTIALGPFGLANFTHGEKVASSATFRGVSEWLSPLKVATPAVPLPQFPPVWRFWLILGVAILALVAAQILGAVLGTPGARRKAAPIRCSPIDPLPLLIGLAMTFWARRFAPIVYIFGAPVVLVWILRMTAGLSDRAKRYSVIALCALAWPATILVAWETTRNVYKDLIAPYADGSEMNLLERVTQFNQTPQDSIDYLKNNALTPNTFIEWTQAGPLMFHWPQAKVFMDGRAQQLYDETTYAAYTRIVDEQIPRDLAFEALNLAGEVATTVSPRPRVDVVLLRQGRAIPLTEALERSSQWVICFVSQKSILFVRRDSDTFRRIGELNATGREWRPETGELLFSRGKILLATQPPDDDGAIRAFQRSIELSSKTELISMALSSISYLYTRSDRLGEARTYFTELKSRSPGKSDADRQNLLFQLENLIKSIDQRLTTRPATSRPDK
jgi:hypothetical protein